jgi:hypothetical protein
VKIKDKQGDGSTVLKLNHVFFKLNPGLSDLSLKPARIIEKPVVRDPLYIERGQRHSPIKQGFAIQNLM